MLTIGVVNAVTELGRDDITVIGIPLSQLCNEHFDGVRARILMKNIAYVGALALGRRFQFDEKHARHVARLALSLFDQLQDLHQLGVRRPAPPVARLRVERILELDRIRG